ncbi:hypothetical protein N7478_000707 [Penicillium angulare]|uniref:uncharacterized protein n=1 Tax=Penicillium angulare TaxID=116970 RepID=UPI0025420A1A|nr:uncharacterized protein N7478_000707 [Penicillium angulare]KAJ5291456.1 hypothetical protein N7478_000707 [Penicillium angulare]
MGFEHMNENLPREQPKALTRRAWQKRTGVIVDVRVEDLLVFVMVKRARFRHYTIIAQYLTGVFLSSLLAPR